MSALIDIFDWWAAERKDTPAIVHGDDQVTFGELKSWSRTIADDLIALGVNIGDRIVALSANSIEYCVLTQGVIRAGAILCSINPRSTLDEAYYMVERYEPIIIYCDKGSLGLAEKLTALSGGKIILRRLEDLRELRHAGGTGASDRVCVDQDAPVVIIGTSGSTGRPKGVIWTHKTVSFYMMEFALAEPVATDHPRIILFAPLSISAGWVLLTQYAGYGGTVYISNSFDPESALRLIVDKKITGVMGAPVFLERIAACEGFAAADLSSVVMASVGGARVSEQLLNAWLSKNVLLRQIYGQTEVGGQCTINPEDVVRKNPNTCGRGMPLTRMKIIDADGRDCPPGEPGQILVKGPAVMAGYWRDPEATAKTKIDGWIHTGDCGVIDDEGLLTFLDRIKDIIISGGLNISAAELERVAVEFPGVEEAVALAARDEKFGETPMLVIYAPEEVDLKALIEHFNVMVSDYKVPRYIAVEKQPLPRLSGGKVSKKELREKYRNAHMELPRLR